MNYDDIIDLPHFHAPGKPYMSSKDRAAQFASYKSLNGYEDEISEKTEEIMNEPFVTYADENEI